MSVGNTSRGPQSVVVLGPHVVHLVGQLVGDPLAEERGQEEILHRVEGRRLVEAAFVVVLFSEDVLSAVR